MRLATERSKERCIFYCNIKVLMVIHAHLLNYRRLTDDAQYAAYAAGLDIWELLL